jgi:hypothetical protein
VSPFFDALRQPEYIHVPLNPVPVYGLALSVLALSLALAGALAAWIAYPGGKVRHREFCNEPPPALTSQNSKAALPLWL